jgi:hypothetical protein
MGRVVVTIPRNGIANGEHEIQVDAQNFAGTGCRTATAAFQAMAFSSQETIKPEMYESDQTVHLFEEER